MGEFRAVNVECFRGRDGLSQSVAYDVAQDRDGSLWVATRHGLNQFLDGRTIPFTTREGLPSNMTGPLLAVGDEAWIGTLDAGLVRKTHERIVDYGTAQGLPSPRVQALGRVGETVWFGTDLGLLRMEQVHVGQDFRPTMALRDQNITALLGDRDERLWIGTTAGLEVLEHDGFAPIPAVSEAIVSLLERREGGILTATKAGQVFLVRDGKATTLVRTGQISSVSSLFELPDGTLLFGTTGNGLFLRSPDGVIRVARVVDGLFDDDLCTMVADGQGRVWFGCSKGLFSVAIEGLRAYSAGTATRLTSLPISPTDALRTIECRAGVFPASARMADDNLWFSSTRGIIIVDPVRLNRRLKPPAVGIEAVNANGRTLEDQSFHVLLPGQNNLGFAFTAFSYVSPAHTAFRYKLEGFDREWITPPVGSAREAHYANLPPGDYRFRVAAITSDNDWADPAVQEAIVSLTLMPAFYQRAWFWPACVTAGVLAAFAFYRLRLRAERERMALVTAERLRIARELHDTLLQGLSGVTMEMQALHSKLPDSEHRRTLGDIILDASGSLREARRSITGLRDPRPTELTLPQRLQAAVKDLTRAMPVDARVRLPDHMSRLSASVEHALMRIAVEAVGNAVRHADARAIEVLLAVDGDRGKLCITDDGSGFDPATVAPGHYGLVGMRERAAEIGADFRLESTRGKGTAIAVEFPLRVAGEPTQ